MSYESSVPALRRVSGQHGTALSMSRAQARVCSAAIVRPSAGLAERAKNAQVLIISAESYPGSVLAARELSRRGLTLRVCGLLTIFSCRLRVWEGCALRRPVRSLPPSWAYLPSQHDCQAHVPGIINPIRPLASEIWFRRRQCDHQAQAQRGCPLQCTARSQWAGHGLHPRLPVPVLCRVCADGRQLHARLWPDLG